MRTYFLVTILDISAFSSRLKCRKNTGQGKIFVRPQGCLCTAAPHRSVCLAGIYIFHLIPSSPTPLGLTSGELFEGLKSQKECHKIALKIFLILSR